jgi:hypothetical protein
MVSLVFYNVQSVPITIEVVSFNPSHGEVYLIQHYVIKFVSDMRQVGDFFLIIDNNIYDNSFNEELLNCWL